jgi:hypothetical protein
MFANFRYLKDNLDLLDRYVLYREEHAEEARMGLEEMREKVAAARERTRLKAEKNAVKMAIIEGRIKRRKSFLLH